VAPFAAPQLTWIPPATSDAVTPDGVATPYVTDALGEEMADPPGPVASTSNW